MTISIGSLSETEASDISAYGILRAGSESVKMMCYEPTDEEAAAVERRLVEQSKRFGKRIHELVRPHRSTVVRKLIILDGTFGGFRANES